MKISSKILLLAFSMTAISASCDKNTGDPAFTGELPDPIKVELRRAETEMVKSDQQFAFEFFANVFDAEAADEDANFMVSPFSLSMALAMVWNGADGETKKAIQETLKMGDYTDEEVNGYYNKLKEAFVKTDPSTKLSIANSIWTNQYVEIKPDFIHTNERYYDATVQAVDFTDSGTKDRINQWASDNTNGLIREVIKETKKEDLMYLLNALYFKGIWTSEFEPKDTSKRLFTYENGVKKNVDMMQQTDKFNYTADETLQAVQLPYGNQAFSMIVLLPQEGKTLQDGTTELQKPGYWANITGGLRNAEVDLYLPKFKTEYSKKLNEVLQQMGMGLAFTNAADFSRMSDLSAKISLVKQDTYVSTDESGTEAAAVTTVGMELTSLPSQPQKVIFNANKPFIYVIQENSTGAILFTGAVKDFEE